MLKAMKEDFDSRFAEYAKRGEMCLEMAYTGNQEEAEEFKKETPKSKHLSILIRYAPF
jgi:hypothetical protein